MCRRLDSWQNLERKHLERDGLRGLRKVRGDTGGREVIRETPEEVLPVQMPSADVLIDIDTMQDYHNLIASRQANQG